MIVEIEIPEDQLRQLTIDATLRALQTTINRLCEQKVAESRNMLEHAVDLHLAKRLTDGDIKKMIETAVQQRVREAIDEI